MKTHSAILAIMTVSVLITLFAPCHVYADYVASVNEIIQPGDNCRSYNFGSGAHTVGVLLYDKAYKVCSGPIFEFTSSVYFSVDGCDSKTGGDVFYEQDFICSTSPTAGKQCNDCMNQLYPNAFCRRTCGCESIFCGQW